MQKISFGSFIAGVILAYGKADKESQILFLEALKNTGDYEIVGHSLLFISDFVEERSNEFFIKKEYTFNSNVALTPGCTFSLRKRLEAEAYGPVLDLVKQLQPEIETPKEKFGFELTSSINFIELPNPAWKNWFVIQYLLSTTSGQSLLACRPIYIFADASLQKNGLEIEFVEWDNIDPKKMAKADIKYCNQFSLEMLFVTLRKEVQTIVMNGQIRKAVRYLAIIEKSYSLDREPTYFVRAILKAEATQASKTAFFVALNPKLEEKITVAEGSKETDAKALIYKGSVQ